MSTITSYTSGLRLTNQPDGGNANTWGEIADNNFEFIDDAITSRVSVDITGGNSYTLTVGNGVEDEARRMNIYIHGVPSSANSIIIPASEKFYMVRAAHTSVSGGITVRTAGGTGVNLLTGDKGVVYCDGVSVEFYGQPFIPTSALDPSQNLADLPNVSVARSNLGLQPAGPYLQIVSGSSLQFTASTLFNAMWPIGSLYSNRTDGTNPGTLMGFGTWVSAGTGRVPVGVGTGTDVNGVSVVINAQTCGGEYVHAMTTAELIRHRHQQNYQFRSNFDATGGININLNGDASGPLTGRYDDFEGGSQPFNIQQPWYSVYQWIRTA